MGTVVFGILMLYLLGGGLLREFGRLVFWLRKLEAVVKARRAKVGEA